ncbi:type VI secretion system tip protein VgrG [Pseudomonas fulva]|uniref:type VI secretion system Vgr family protein n=1 Tax=Pseudomonas fulva TaxID=47880 RepID=UPI00142898DE|nr:type VI secretion system tip protein TssI/VgrG [Pseudomonas fulva]NIX94312.1 type VI secretion system tip protein VgrG [Pseudomonas fulva]
MPRQSDLRFTVTAPVGDFEVAAFTLDEALSEPFQLHLELSSFDPAIDFAQLLDQPLTLHIAQSGTVRHVHGLVSTFEQADTGHRRTRYRAVVEPALARLGLCSDWRIFQALSIPQIIEQVLKQHHITDIEIVSTREHLPREYCVQAGETDLDFVERLAAEEGFYYAFGHRADGHRLIVSDRLYSHCAIDGDPVTYNPSAGGDQPAPALRRFTYTEQVRTARQTQRDYTFTHPRYNQQHTTDGPELDHQQRDYERYDYPGRYKRDEAGKPFTQTRLLALRGDARLARVEGDDARLLPGPAFQLTGHPREDMNRGWRTLRLHHEGVQTTSQQEEAADAEQGTRYHFSAELLDLYTQWCAPLPAKPRIDGPHIATVVGPKDEEIYCDEFGRVKVQFPWDRLAVGDEHSSCWIRVAQNWAGAAWGHIAIPRIGQEVIVDFLDGDCDQPIITGRTYPATHPTPYELPRHKTRMTIKSQTHKGQGFNELRFEDEHGQEEIFIHAQKDQNIRVGNDETIVVGRDRSEQVEHDETITIGHDRQETVGNDEQVTIGQDRRHAIGQDNYLNIARNHNIQTGKDRIEEVGNDRRDKTTADHWIDIGGHLYQKVEGRVELQAGQAIVHKTQVYEIQASEAVVLKAPGGTLRIDGSGITLNGVSLQFNGPLALQANGSGHSIAASGVPTPSDPVCVSCLLKAIAEGRSVVRMEGI